jgi:ParB-like chromosome segregation protein Spo0J
MVFREVSPGELDLSLGRLRQFPEAAVREKAASLRSKGQLTPVVAAEQGGLLVLVDGFVRHLAAVRLGLPTLLVEVIQVSPVQMKAQVYLRNRDRGLMLLEECRLVVELSDQDGLSQVEIGDALERHKSWVCRRLGLYRSLSPHLLADASVGLIEGGSLRRLAQLPARNQEELVAVARRDGLSSRETSVLVDLWRRATDGEARRYVMEHPLEAIRRVRAGRERPVDARLGKAGCELLESLLVVRQASLRMQRRLRDGLGELPTEGMTVLAAARDRAEDDCATALREVRGWLSRAGSAGEVKA